MKIIKLCVIVLIIGALVLSAYVLVARFLKDREKALGFTQPLPLVLDQRNLPRTESKTYTAEELEKARREGKPLPGMAQQPYRPPTGTVPSDDATQRSLRTLEEINRINQLNQRLIEQNQRMQNQR